MPPGGGREAVTSRLFVVYERRNEKLIPLPRFAKRVFAHVFFASTIVAGSLAIGIAGYHYLGGLRWIDAFLNASMILGGMGPVDPLVTPAAKLFAGLYALFAGLLFIGISAIVFGPFIHRLLHHFHLEND